MWLSTQLPVFWAAGFLRRDTLMTGGSAALRHGSPVEEAGAQRQIPLGWIRWPAIRRALRRAIRPSVRASVSRQAFVVSPVESRTDRDQFTTFQTTEVAWRSSHPLKRVSRAAFSGFQPTHSEYFAFPPGYLVLSRSERVKHQSHP